MSFLRRTIQLPMKRKYIGDVRKYAFRFLLSLDIRGPDTDYTALPFRLDTGTDFMTISQRMAREQGIPFSEDCPVFPLGASGRAKKPSFISPVYFSFPQLPDWEFKTDCAFSPYELPYGLFGLTDFAPHFVVRSNKVSAGFPEGSVVFQLRADHGGSPRP
jgi:hypothetical protein